MQGRRAFWFDEPEYLWISVLTSFATFFLWTQVSSATGVEEDGAAMFWSDALGLGAFCVIGAQNAIRARLPLVTALVTAGITCTGGGVIRDTLCKRPVRVINSHMELYGSTALSGVCVYFTLRRFGVPLPVRILGGMATCIGALPPPYTRNLRALTRARFAAGMRYASWTYNLKLPTHPNGDAVLKVAISLHRAAHVMCRAAAADARAGIQGVAVDGNKSLVERERRLSSHVWQLPVHSS
jgi:hypothetical protein